MGGVLDDKIKPLEPVQSITEQKFATSAASSVVNPAQRTDAGLFLPKLAILEQLRVDDPKRRQFIQDEMKKQEVLTEQGFDPEKEYTLEKFLEKYGTMCDTLKNIKSDSIENIGMEAMSKACHLIGKDPSMTTEFTYDTGGQYANRIKNNLQKTENTNAISTFISSPVPQGFNRG